MSETIKITEVELKKLIKENIEYQAKRLFMLCEEGHYPEFLNSFKNEIADKAIQKLINGGFKKAFYINVGKNDYVRWIKIIPTYALVKNINNVREYGSSYFANKAKFVLGKFIVGTLKLRIPYNENNETNYTYVKDEILHELNHLYDDWMKRTIQKKRGEKPTPLTDDEKLKAVYNLGKISKFWKLTDAAYRMLKTEQQAFLSTVPNDLASLHATKDNINSSSRRTSCYSEAWDSFSFAFETLNECDDEYLSDFNDTVREYFKQSGLPYMTNEKFSAEKYRAILWDWFKYQYEIFLKRFWRVVQYYLDHIPKDINEPFYHVPILSPTMHQTIKIREAYDNSLGITFHIS